MAGRCYIAHLGWPIWRAVRARLAWCCIVAFAAGYPFCVAAQVGAEPAPPASPDQEITDGEAVFGISRRGSTVIYHAEFFERYNPVNVNDMLRRIPGTASIIASLEAASAPNAEVVRGFGSGGESILINGKRLAGKSNDSLAALERIQAAQVERIELIRGTSTEIDVRSEGTLINIVLGGDIDQSVGSWRLGGTYYDDGVWRPGGFLSYAGVIGKLAYSASAELEPMRRNERRFEIFSDPDGTAFQERDETLIRRQSDLKITANVEYSFANGDELRLNGLYLDESWERIETSNQSNPDIDGIFRFFQTQLMLTDNDQFEWEIGGDYERRMGSSGILKVLFVHGDKTDDFREDQRVIRDGVDTLLNVEVNDQGVKETIVRPSYRWRLASNHGLELGVEGTINKLDSSLKIAQNQDGILVELDIPLDSSAVKEYRVEAFSTHTWNISPKLTLESALNYEYSKIETISEAFQTSVSFDFFKPAIDLRYDITPRNQIAVRVERTASQLDLEDFVPSFQSEDNTVDLGNPALMPETAWEFEVTFEHRLANDQGLILIRGFYDDIQDHIDTIDAGNNRPAAGNIGSAFRAGGEIEASVRLTPLGLPDAFISGNYLRQETRVTDPFQGIKRNFFQTEDWKWSASYRHDIAAWRLSYGVMLEQTGPRPTREIDQFRRFTEKVKVEAFVEVQVFFGLTARFEARRLTRNANALERIRFVGNIADGIVSRREKFDRDEPREFFLSLRGNF